MAKFAAAHGITEGQKRQTNKQTGPKKDFASVEEREQQVLNSVPERHCQNLCRQLSSNVAAARPQPLLLDKTRMVAITQA